MGHCDDVISDVRHQIDASAASLGEARTRLALVKELAAGFAGAKRTYSSGSIAQHTMIAPVTDGDGGVVLDRRSYPELGPEAGGEAPGEVAEKLCAFLGPEVRERYPRARCGTSKRGPKLHFGAPVEDQDPTVDLVIALTRRDGPGLWIPNLEKDTWEASDPELHAELLNGEPVALRRTRRQVIRLAKAWNGQFSRAGVLLFPSVGAGPGIGTGRPGAPGGARPVLRGRSQFAAPRQYGGSSRGVATDQAPPQPGRGHRPAGQSRRCGQPGPRTPRRSDGCPGKPRGRVLGLHRGPGVQSADGRGEHAATAHPGRHHLPRPGRRRGTGEAGQGLRRHRAAVIRSRVWQRPAWYVYPAGRLGFLTELRACGVHAVSTRINRADRRHRGGFQVEFKLTVPGLPARHVRIVFAGTGFAPSVYADGPTDSRHRYSDGSLCMWYPHDPDDARWTRRDGAAALLGHITAHLLREEWWRKTGEWVGDEVSHDAEDNTDRTKIG